MKALTICEPFASAIAFGGKDIENRRQPLNVVGPCIIHAGKSLAWYEDEMCEWVHDRWPDCPENPIEAMQKFKPRHGMAIGVAWFDGAFKIEHAERFGGAVEKPKVSVWATGPWCLPVRGVVAIKPFYLRGQQGPFVIPAASLPEDVIAAAEALTEQFGPGRVRA